MRSNWLAAKRKIFYFSDNTVADPREPDGSHRLAAIAGTCSSLINGAEK